MRKRRFSISLAILLPVTVALAIGLTGLYFGGYLALKQSASEAQIRDDAQDLSFLKDEYAEGNYNLLGYGLVPVIEAYEKAKPEAMPQKGSPEEEAYKAAVLKASSSQLYESTEKYMERFVTTFVGIFYEDVAKNRMVLVCTTNNKTDQAVQETSLYLGAFFNKPDYFADGSFYGKTISDENLGPMFASGIYVAEIKHPTQPSGTYRVWLIRESTEASVYNNIPEFATRFGIIAVSFMVALTGMIFLLLFFLIVRPTKRLAVKGNAYTAMLQSGKEGPSFEPSQNFYRNELSDLNDSFYYLQESITDYADKVRKSAAYEEKINADLALAERIQSAMVPNKPLVGNNFLIRGHMKPAKEVGGDLYSYYQIDEDHVGFFIGDVSGKGVPAALFMAKANTLLRLTLKDFDIEEANDTLCEGNAENFFVTAFLAVLNTKTGDLRYVNCGHEPVFICRDGKYGPLHEEPNFMLGCLDGFEYTIQKTKLHPGERLFLYTDGVSEAMDVDGNLFGKERILDCLNQHVGLPSELVFASMNESVANFVGKAEQSDDACMVALDYANERSLVFETTPEGLSKVAPFVDDYLQDKSAETLAHVQIILDELCSNVVYYSESNNVPTSLVLRDDGTAVYCSIIDSGKPFNPLEDSPEKDPDKPGGLGIIMARSMTDTMSYRRVDNKNILQFVKKYA